MEVALGVTLVVGTASIVLACVAIWHSLQSERRSAESLEKTKELLSQVNERAGIIQESVNTTQQKLVDAITDIARPKQQPSSHNLISVLPDLLQNRLAIQELLRIGKGIEEDEDNDKRDDEDDDQNVLLFP